MNKSQDELNKLRAAHSDKWQQLAGAGFKPQRIAAIIEQHIADDTQRLRDNPPEKQAQAQAAAAAAIVRTHLERATLAKGEFDKLVSELRAQFPEIEFEVITLETSLPEVARLNEHIEQLRDELKQALEENIKAAEERDTALASLQREQETLNTLMGDFSKKAEELQFANEKITAVCTERDALSAKITNAIAAKSLKAAHEALT